MRTSRKLLLLVALGLATAALTACGGMDHSDSSGSVEATDAWARTSAPGQEMGAIYLMLHGGAEADVLTGVSVPSSVAASASMHETAMADTGETMDMDHAMEMGDASMADGAMTMREVARVDVPADGMVMFEPGGLHIMLMGLVAPLERGSTFDLTLRFAKGGDTTVTVTVRDA